MRDLKRERRGIVIKKGLGIVVLQDGTTVSSSLTREFQKRGVKLATVSVPGDRSFDEKFIAVSVDEALQGIENIELVLAFADSVGEERPISKCTPEETKAVFAVNVVRLKLFLDEIFRSGRNVSQVSVITFSSEAIGTKHPSFEVAIAGLEMMVKLYALEREGCHFSIVALHQPWDRRQQTHHVAETITDALRHPSGVLLDEHGRPWRIAHPTERSHFT